MSGIIASIPKIGAPNTLSAKSTLAIGLPINLYSEIGFNSGRSGMFHFVTPSIAWVYDIDLSPFEIIPFAMLSSATLTCIFLAASIFIISRMVAANSRNGIQSEDTDVLPPVAKASIFPEAEFACTTLI